ncbi:MAG: guanylate kinase [Dokdonella sp.]|uniref:guanylate kinase n=1 Tax=Dokdonella sp. TaxID=2291710 RepID=UPI0025C0A19E|nr:guanylate kinase [Dokdonella sp.]MBX3701420.1 guanylate kinase [Dokdonella sp.]
MSGTLYIVAAPSGAGKTSLVNALLERAPDIALSVSYTSRLPRPNEVDGQHYHFVSRQMFEQMAARGAFYEYADVHGDLKGTSREAVEPLLAQGRDVLLEIDWQGAAQVRAAHPGSVSVFILPPSRAELERRLRARASDSAATIARRLANSREEVAHAADFDYIVVNDDFAAALAELHAIVCCQRLRAVLQLRRHAALLDDLLKAD